jgi:hypothetical protein
LHIPFTKNGESRDVPLSRHATDTLTALSKHKQPAVDLVFPMSGNSVRLAFERENSDMSRAAKMVGGLKMLVMPKANIAMQKVGDPQTHRAMNDNTSSGGALTGPFSHTC